MSAYPHESGLTICFRDVSERRSLDDNGAEVHENADVGNQEITD